MITKIRLSRWIHSYERDGVMALINTLSLGMLFVSLDIGKRILKLMSKPNSLSFLANHFNQEILKALISEKIVVPQEFDDLAYLHQIREHLLKSISLELLYLLVTDNCNLKCKYCFEETPMTKTNFCSTQMKSNTAIQALDMFAKLSKKYGDPQKKKIIHIYGGEPLLNQPVVIEAILYVDKLKKKKILPNDCSVAIVTNGVLLTDSMARLFAQHNVIVGLSLDGPRNINNAYRIGKKESLDVYSAIIRAYELLKRHGAKIGLSVTLTPMAIENFDETLSFFLNDLGIADGISLNLLHYNNVVQPDESYYKQATDCQIKAFRVFREKGIYEERIMRKARAFVDKKVIYADCGVVGYQLVVAPDGQIGVCQDFVKPRTYFQDSVSDPKSDPIANGLFEGWKRRSPLFMNQCLDCPAIGICGGGCPASAELKTGNRWNIDERVCYHSKHTLEWLVWDTFTNLP